MADQNQPQPGANVPAAVNTKKSNAERLRSAMDAPSVQQTFQSVLKSRTDSFKTSLIELYTNDSKLIQCDPGLVISEALKMAVMGLPVNKTLGFSWIIPYKKRRQGADGKWQDVLIPQAQLGYKGILQLAIRTGKYEYINADVVYEGELKHKDKLTGEIDLSGEPTSSKVIGYFAHLQTLDGFRKTLYSTTDQVKAHAERYSKNWDPTEKNNIWNTNFDEMAIKTVLRGLLSKWGLLSPELEQALADDIKSDSKIGDSVQDEIDQHANTVFTDFNDVTDSQGNQVDPDTGEVKSQQLAQGDPQITIPLDNKPAEPVTRRGRPAGSTNKPKEQQAPNPSGGEEPPTWN